MDSGAHQIKRINLWSIFTMTSNVSFFQTLWLSDMCKWLNWEMRRRRYTTV